MNRRRDEWISVDDRLPDTSRDVLVCLTDNQGDKCTEVSDYHKGEWFTIYYRQITHWKEIVLP